MKLEGKSYAHYGMRNIDRWMNEYFGDDIELVRYWGPEQMCVFNLIYKYKPMDYTITIDCERGFVVPYVKNAEGKGCCPLTLYLWKRHAYYFEDRDDHMKELVRLTYKAVKRRKLRFKESEIYDLL